MSHKTEEKSAEAKKKSCFIAMPISTPEYWRPAYGGDPDHFKHVLQCLFIPAIEKAGLTPIPPISQGSDIIHADIIHNLQTADLVLVDMSSLNANVFFEFGIRVSLDKPICLVRDDKTDRVPFDAALINNHTYLSALNAWENESQIERLACHLSAATTPKASRMSLWRSFGFTAKAEALSGGKSTTDDKVEYLITVVDKLSRRLNEGATPGASFGSNRTYARDYKFFLEDRDIQMQFLKEVIPRVSALPGISSVARGLEPGHVNIVVTGDGVALEDVEVYLKSRYEHYRELDH